MIITEQERKDIVALFNAQDAAGKLRSATIEVNGAEVICYETGEIERSHPQTGETIRNFGGYDSGRYLIVSIRGRLVKAHRLIYSAFNGELPQGLQVDHIDGDKSNNCISNLRALTCQENSRASRRKRKGSTSQYRGVSWHKRDKCWRASIMVQGKAVHLGGFKSEMDAARGYDEAVMKFNYPIEALNF